MGNACAGCCCAAWNELRERENLNFDRRTSHGRVDYILAFGTGRRFVSSPHKFLAFRITLFALMLAVLCWSVADAVVQDVAEFWFIYLTNWTLLIEVVYLACAVYTTAALRPRALHRIAGTLPPTPGFSAGMPQYVKVTWALQSVVLPASFMVRNIQRQRASVGETRKHETTAESRAMPRHAMPRSGMARGHPDLVPCLTILRWINIWRVTDIIHSLLKLCTGICSLLVPRLSAQSFQGEGIVSFHARRKLFRDAAGRLAFPPTLPDLAWVVFLSLLCDLPYLERYPCRGKHQECRRRRVYICCSRLAANHVKSSDVCSGCGDYRSSAGQSVFLVAPALPAQTSQLSTG